MRGKSSQERGREKMMTVAGRAAGTEGRSPRSGVSVKGRLCRLIIYIMDINDQEFGRDVD